MGESPHTADDGIEFTTDRGTDVTVTAENGDLHVSAPEVSHDLLNARIDEHEGVVVLNAGPQVIDGESVRPMFPIGDRKEEIKALREESKPAGRDHTEEEKEALEEAAETGEEVVIQTYSRGCNDPSKECDVDRVSRVATPDGEIEARRIHCY